MTSLQDFRDVVGLLEHLFKENALIFRSRAAVFKSLATKSLAINERIPIPKEDQLRLASLYMCNI
jgi:hypothetical protein